MFVKTDHVFVVLANDCCFVQNPNSSRNNLTFRFRYVLTSCTPFCILYTEDCFKLHPMETSYINTPQAL